MASHEKKIVEEFVSQCPVCQVTKIEHIHPPGLLDPIEVAPMAWAHISLDFIEALPKAQGKEVILVVVDRLTKYAHFIPLSHPYSVQSVFQALMDNVIKLHGIPLVIISDRDRIFTSKLYKELFDALDVELRFSTTDHPQTDGQTERVNQRLEAYLRGMVFQEPKQWIKWLPLVELWYNTSYHTSLKCTPFEVLYGYKPPQICELSIPSALSSEAKITLESREQMIQKLKENLLQA